MTAVLGKKNRQAQHITILALPGEEDAVIEAAFIQTTTLGVRVHHCARRTLPREMRLVDETGVKIAYRPGGSTAKAESDDLRNRGASTALSRAAVARAATAEALKLKGGGE